MKVCRVAEMRAMDREATERFGIPELVLMENAGEAAWRVLRAEMGPAARAVAVVAGTGNNGGDGLVVARKVHAAGGAARVVLVGDPERYRGAARVNHGIVVRLPVEIVRVDSAASVAAALAGAECVVDGLFGTGLDRPVEGLARDVLAAVNASGLPVLGLDIPSGVSGDTGAVLGVAARADHTVTFGLPKLGNVLPPGSDVGGRLHVSHISMPPALYDSAFLRVSLSTPPDLSALPRVFVLPGVAPFAAAAPTPPPVVEGVVAGEAAGPAVNTCRIVTLSELAELGGASSAAVANAAVDAARDVAERLQVPVVLTGARTIVGLPDGRAVINTSGGGATFPASGRALAGGVIAALRASGLDLPDAAEAGVFLHGLAYDLTAGDLGPASVTDHDVVLRLPQAEALLRRALAADLAARYAGADLVG